LTPIGATINIERTTTCQYLENCCAEFEDHDDMEYMKSFHHRLNHISLEVPERRMMCEYEQTEMRQPALPNTISKKAIDKVGWNSLEPSTFN
jgi:hypothetical protein